MSSESTFKGTVIVSSIPGGYKVKLDCETDAHDLGHALAAAITSYTLEVQALHPDSEPDEVRRYVLDGIACALGHCEPLRKH